MLIGDRTGIDRDINDAFGVAGFGHILAVSGLHIGFVISLFGFLLGRLLGKHRRKIIFAIVSALAVFYAYIAGFSPPVIRAVIMFMAGGFTLFGGDRRDSLNTLGIAVCCMLIFRPFWLFDAAFLMSTMSVLGIIFFYKPIRQGIKRGLNWLTKDRRQKKEGKPKIIEENKGRGQKIKEKIISYISEGLAISTSAQIGIFPVFVVVFSRINTYSVIVNFVSMPILTIIFMVLFAGLLIALAIPVLSVIVFAVPYAGLMALEFIAVGFAGLPAAQLPLFFGVAAAICIAVMYFIISRFVMIKRKRWVRLACIAVCFLLGFSGWILPYSASGSPLMIPTSQNADTLFINSDYSAVFVGNNTRRLHHYLHFWRVRNLEAVFLDRVEFSDVDNLLRLHGGLRPLRIYAPYEPDQDTLASLTGTGIQFDLLTPNRFREYGEYEISAVFCDNSEIFLGYAVNYDGSTNIFIESSSNSFAQMESELREIFAILRVTAPDPIFESNINPDAVIITTYSHAYLQNLPQIHSLERRGYFALALRQGTLHAPRFWF